MISLMSIAALNSIIETEFSHLYIVCAPEQKSSEIRGYMRAIEIHIIGFWQLFYLTEEFDYTVKIVFISPVGSELIFGHIVCWKYLQTIKGLFLW